MAQKIFVAVDNSSLFDIALNTYGSLDFIGKLIEDNPENGLNFYPTAGTQFVWDDSLQISQTNAIIGGSGMFVGQKFATRPTDEPQANFAPINILPPTISGAISVGSTLTAISGAWSGLPTPALSYQWQSSTDGGITWGNIVGQIGTTYVLAPGDELKEIRVNQIATNALGTAERASAYVQPYASGGGSSIPPSVSVAPTSFVAGGGAPVIGSYLVLSPGAWVGDGPITFTYEWKIGATVVGIAQVYQVQASDFGQTIVGKVIATNAYGVADSTTTGITAVQKPINTVAPVISGTDIVGSVLTTTNGTWTGNATITFGYQWLRNGSPISLATSSTYTQVLADMGQTITCRIVGTNSYGTGEAVSNAITPRYAPVNVDAPVVYGLSSVGSVLSAFTGNWTEYPSSSKARNWQFSTDNGSTWNNYSPAQTGSTYTIVSGDAGRLIRVQITATNSAGNGSANSTSFDVPAPAVQRPENTVAPAITGTPSIGSTLTCSTGTWNGSPTGFVRQWYRGTTPVGTNSANYTLVSADVDSIISCVVSATNAGGTEPATSNSIYAYDADFYAVIAHANTNSYALPTTAQLQTFSQLVTRLKTLNFWSKFDVFWWMVNDNTSGQAFARINWKNPSAFYLNPINAPTWTANAGYTLNGTTQYLDTGFNPATNGVQYTLNDAGRYMYHIRTSTTVASVIDGNSTANDNTMRVSASGTQHTVNSGTTLPATAVFGNASYFHAITRTSSTVATRFTDVGLAVNVASSAITSANQWIGRGGTSYALNGSVFGFYAMGASIAAADLPDFRNTILKYIDL